MERVSEASYEADLLELERLAKSLSQLTVCLKALRSSSYPGTPLIGRDIDEIAPWLSANLKYLLEWNNNILKVALRSIGRHLSEVELDSARVGSDDADASTHRTSTTADNRIAESLLLTAAASSVQQISDGSRQSSTPSLTSLAAVAAASIPSIEPILHPQAVGESHHGILDYDQIYREPSTDCSSPFSPVLTEDPSIGLGLAKLHAAETQPETASSSLQAQSDNQSSSASSHQTPPLVTAFHPKDASRSRKSRKRADPHRCGVCSKIFTRGTTLREHARTHTNEKPYKCATCDKGFSRLKDCRRHELLHVPDEGVYCAGRIWDGNWQRWGCNSSFTRIDALRAHLKSGRGATCLEEPFKYEKHFLRRFSLGHVACHGDLENQPWGCGMDFKTFHDLKEHLEAHENDDCFVGLSVPEKQRLMDLVVEAASFPYACHKIYDGCGSRFESEDGLKAHIYAPFRSYCMRSKIISKAMRQLT